MATTTFLWKHYRRDNLLYPCVAGIHHQKTNLILVGGDGRDNWFDVSGCKNSIIKLI